MAHRLLGLNSSLLKPLAASSDFLFASARPGCQRRHRYRPRCLVQLSTIAVRISIILPTTKIAHILGSFGLVCTRSTEIFRANLSARFIGVRKQPVLLRKNDHCDLGTCQDCQFVCLLEEPGLPLDECLTARQSTELSIWQQKGGLSYRRSAPVLTNEFNLDLATSHCRIPIYFYTSIERITDREDGQADQLTWRRG